MWGAVMRRVFSSVTVCLFLTIPVFAVAQITRVSVASDGTGGNAASQNAAISKNGRFVAFSSEATNLAGGTGGTFVHDRAAGATTLIASASGDIHPSISGDGRYVFYGSSNAAGFVKDLQTNSTQTVLGPPPTIPGAGQGIWGGVLSADGRHVAYFGDPRLHGHFIDPAGVFVTDLDDGTICAANVAMDGTPGDGDVLATLRFPFYETPAVSADGRFVAFSSTATNLLGPGLDTNGHPDVFVHDCVTGETTRVSVTSNGAQSNGPSFEPSISADGHLVAFATTATTLGADGRLRAVVVHDRTTGRTFRAQITFDNEPIIAMYPQLSGDGRFLVVRGIVRPTYQNELFRHDLQRGITQRVALTPTGSSPDRDVFADARPLIDQTGRFVAFHSTSSDLVSGDTNQCTFNGPNCADVFVRDFDVDADGIGDDWETLFELDWLNPADAASDADGDGRTNADEYAAFTHPTALPSATRYFAEGAQSSFFAAQFAFLNPDTLTAAVVQVRFVASDGSLSTQPITVPPLSRRTMNAGGLNVLGSTEFTTIIESNVAIIVDRTMTWDSAGYGSHAETSIAAPSTNWYLAEGATHSGFDLFYLIQNPNDASAHVQVQYLLPAGAPIIKNYVVATTGRFNIWVDLDDPRLASIDVSAVITSDLPIVVERAMYLSSGGKVFNAGHESAGVTTPATEWFLAEGATGDFFDEFVLVANPSNADAHVQAAFLLPDGTSIVKSYVVAANSRFNIWVDGEDARLADTAVSTVITSLNSVPIVAERSMWWPGPTAATWSEAHNSAGLTSSGRKWALAEGEVGGSRGIETFILIANRGNLDTAGITLLYEDGSSESKQFTLNPGSRTNVAVASDFPNSVGKRFGAIIEAASPGAQIAVERAMYFNANGVVWAAGTDAVGTKLQ
jgi:hypothetical protein